MSGPSGEQDVLARPHLAARCGRVVYRRACVSTAMPDRPNDRHPDSVAELDRYAGHHGPYSTPK